MTSRCHDRAFRIRPITLTDAQLRRIVRAVREGLEPRRTTLTFIPYPVFTEASSDAASPITAPAHPVPQMMPMPVVAQQSVENRECYYCHVVGHIAKDCPQKPQHQIQQSQTPQSPAPVVLPASVAVQPIVDQRQCYRCFTLGHVVLVCPQRQNRTQPAASCALRSSCRTDAP